MREIPIRDEEIRLGQLLKLAGLVEHGGEAKVVIGDGLVAVNGETETRRGRPLRIGDEVTVHAETVRVAAGS
ncbi:RNA-binding S4 domain-containing protein [Salinifilum aidingensis]